MSEHDLLRQIDHSLSFVFFVLLGGVIALHYMLRLILDELRKLNRVASLPGTKEPK